MRIPAINAYTDPLVNRTTDRIKPFEIASKELNAGNNGLPDIKFYAQNLKDLVTPNERDFFIKMFPENSAQLENHVLFNRNGKLQAVSPEKGLIVDGRV